jgi:hypothetical protein
MEVLIINLELMMLDSLEELLLRVRNRDKIQISHLVDMLLELSLVWGIALS